MLAFVSVDGALSELKVSSETINWRRQHQGWRTWRNGRRSPVESTAAVGRLVRRLSIGSLAKDQPNQVLSGGTKPSDDRVTAWNGASGVREVKINQIIGLKRVCNKCKCDRRSSDKSKKLKPDKESLHESQDSPTGRADQEASVACCGCSAIKINVYYAHKKTDSTTGRLLKLKKLVLAVPGLNLLKRSQAHKSDEQSDEPLVVQHSGCDSSSVIDRLYEYIESQLELVRNIQRPKRLLIFVNPFGGKGQAVRLFERRVCPLLRLARVECELVITKYANHAREMLEDPQFNVEYFDGIACVGGDGMFAELMNGLLFRQNREKLLASDLNRLNNMNERRQRLRKHSHVTTNDESKNNLDESAEHDCDETLDARCSDGDNQYPEKCHIELGENKVIDDAETGKQRGKTRQTKYEELIMELREFRSRLGGIGEPFEKPSIPIGVIGAGSTDANLFSFIGTNDVISATLNIILGKQIDIDVGSVHALRDDRLLRFVSTFMAYGYFGDVVRESEKLRWLGPSRYDVTALNTLIKYRNYEGSVRILCSARDGTPRQTNRCHLDCGICSNEREREADSMEALGRKTRSQALPLPFALARDADELGAGEFEILERRGAFVGVNAAITACRCPQTRKGFSPANHLANGCADLILVRPCTRLQYINYLLRTGYTRKSAFDLEYVEAYRCRQFEFVARRRWRQTRAPAPGDRRKQHNADSLSSLSLATTSSSASSSSVCSLLEISATGAGADGVGIKQRSCVVDAQKPRRKQGQPQQKPKQRLSKCDENDNSTTSGYASSAMITKYSYSGSLDRCHSSTESGATVRVAVEKFERDRCERKRGDVSYSSWNADGEILHEQSIRVKVNRKLLRVFGTGEPEQHR